MFFLDKLLVIVGIIVILLLAWRYWVKHFVEKTDEVSRDVEEVIERVKKKEDELIRTKQVKGALKKEVWNNN